MQMPKRPEQVNIVLTLPEVDIVLQSMGARPYDLVADLIHNIRMQVTRQFEELNAPPAPPAPAAPADAEEVKAGGTD